MKQRYEAFSRGDLESALDLWADDFVWDGGRDSELPGSGTHEGRDQAIQVLQETVGTWDEFQLTADEFFEDGDTVIVLGNTNVKKGDRSAELPVVHIWRFDGDQIKRLQILTDGYQTAQLLGKA